MSLSSKPTSLQADGNSLLVGFLFFSDGSDWHGGRNYFQSLFLALQAQQLSVLRPIVFVGTRPKFAGLGFPKNVTVVRDRALDRLSPKWILNRVAVSLAGAPLVTNRLVRRYGVEVLSHSPPSGMKLIKSIGWIPDFQHVHLPHFFPRAELQARNVFYRQLIEKSALIVVSSEAARQDFERFAPKFATKARVLRFCAVRPDLHASASLDLGARYGLRGRYFYIPNQAWAHKNHLTVIRGLAQLADDYPDVKVVCSGILTDYRNPDHLNKIRAEIFQHRLAEKFILLGVIPYAHIARLMLGSVAVINPSLFEGWSTSVEEAKALGVQLLLSDLQVHREQCPSDEALFFDPLCSEVLADRMRTILRSPRPASPATALERHRQRAAEFAAAYERIVTELFDKDYSE